MIVHKITVIMFPYLLPASIVSNMIYLRPMDYLNAFLLLTWDYVLKYVLHSTKYFSEHHCLLYFGSCYKNYTLDKL